MKGTHISKKTQRKLLKPKCAYQDMSIPTLIKLADKGDMEALRQLRRLCGYNLMI